MLKLFQAELKRVWIEFTRYPLDAIAAVITITVLFYGLFLSARYIAGSSMQFGTRLDAIVFGYVLWNLVIFTVNNISLGLQTEAQIGTLEQLFLSPYGAPMILLARAFASLTIHLVLVVAVLLVITFFTGRQLHFSPSLILPLITVLLGAYGISFSMGALALLFKRVQQLLGLLGFGLLLLLAFPPESWSQPLRFLGPVLPMIPGTVILRHIMVRNSNLDWHELAIALFNGMGYLILGLLVFWVAEKEVKRQGTLGRY
ncbi:ABC transporter permease [Cylindrospermum sp. FACHB-282]|uniref:ABC transporter permease n=1 Tax=Cylindrospermum sp. FACHB-282 TaxID=2692794 RepID=UPI001685835E|nr:ABC transporter permease [Cylindrospermum sp. FACHB-282]MBD2383906.1 ABC transporter permease [Cylindrospermum sp. FACHB-282]